ncbi:MAG: metallopeptidase family M24, partial [Bdellovibrionota bacterium]
VFILDTAPIVDGFVGDIGYTHSLVPHLGLEAAKARLLKFRQDLPGFFSSSLTTAEIWEKVDSETRASGFDNIHAMYPFSVLGHRVYKVPFSGMPGLLYPFGFHAYWAGSSRGLLPELLSPHHRGEKTGVWAIEPHIGGNGFGAKFEEILVVDPSDAHRAWWLSDDVPHMRKFSS